MRGRLPFPSRWLAPLWLAALCGTVQGQTYKVESSKTITIEVPGATAAYSLDSLYAEATVENGVVSISGRMHGTTHVVVVTASGSQPFEIVVFDRPVKRPAALSDRYSMLHAGVENGYVTTVYNSNLGQIQSQADFSRRQDNISLHAHVGLSRVLGVLPAGERGTALASAFYQIATPAREITLLDQYLDESPLTVTGATVRGLHYRQGGWFLHAGYTSMASFDGAFLPARGERMIEAGYRRSLTEHSSLTGSFYDFKVPSSDRVGRSGAVGLLTYTYSPRENFRLRGDLGLSRGAAGSAQLDYKSDKDTIRGDIRYAPATFASLGATGLRGLRSSLSWTRLLTARLSNNLTFYSNKLSLPGIQQSSLTAGTQLQYRMGSHWSLFGGATASSYQSAIPPSPPVRNLSAPAGIGFNSRHFDVQGQYQFSRATQQNPGHQFRASMRAGARSLSVSAYAERQTQAPTLAFVLNQAQRLGRALDVLGLKATTIQDVERLLSDNADLFAAGYIQGATINLTPVRYQTGGSVNWTGHGRLPQLTYNFLYNDNHGLTGSTQGVNHSVMYTQKIGPEDLFVTYSVFGMKLPGLQTVYSNMFSVGWRHQISRVPSLILPERHQLISGVVFRDDNSKGAYEPGMPLLAGAEVKLDGLRRVRTGADGTYRFARVPLGRHRLEVSYKSSKPTFFSTASEVEITENTTVNFGIGFSLSGLAGRLTNDAGQGVPGVKITVRNQDRRWTATTDDDGRFAVRQLAEGDYDVEIDEDSVPPGYLTAELEAQRAKVGASLPGDAVFRVRALRSIAGRVLAYDRLAAKEVPVASRAVTLKEAGKSSVTDALGRYVFRDLPAGTYTVAVAAESGEITKSVTLPGSPLALTHIDLTLGDALSKPAEPAAPAAAPKPIAKPAPPGPDLKPNPATAQEPTARPVPKSAAPKDSDQRADSTARPRERIGRERLGAGEYREAIAELNEAIRLAPGCASAYNARGFAWYKLNDFSRALQDLDMAIQLNPGYVNAYHNRNVVRKAAGDPAGAASDLRREALKSAGAGEPMAQRSAPRITGPADVPAPALSVTPVAPARKHYQTAREMIQTQRFREAIAELNTAIGMTPDFAAAYNARGFARFKLFDYARAIEDLNTAIRLNPKYANAYRVRSAVRNALGDRAGAESDLQRSK